MSKSVQFFLDQLAVESDIMEEQNGNPDEITVVTEETLTELEEDLNSLAEKITDQNAEIDQVIETSDAVVSVESLIVDRINDLRNPEFIASYSKTTHALIRDNIVTSMEGYNFSDKLIRGVLGSEPEFSFEADEENAAGKNAEKASEKSEGWIKKLMTMLAAAASAAKAMFVRILDLFRTSSEKNKRSAAILKKVISEREGQPKNGKMKGKAYSALMAGGKVDPEAAMKLVSDGYTKHLKPAQLGVNKAVKDVSDILIRGSGTGVAEAVRTMVGAIADKAGGKDSKEASAAAVLNVFMSKFPENFNFELPGKREASFELTRKSTGVPTVSFAIGKPTVTAPDEIDVPSLDQIKKFAEVIETGVKLVDGINAEIDENIKLSEKVLTDAEQMAKKPGVDPKDEAPMRAVVGAAQALINASKIFMPKYNEFALKTGNVVYKYGMAAASQYPKKGSAEKTAA